MKGSYSNPILEIAPGEELDQKIAEQIMTVRQLYLYQPPTEFGEVLLPGSGERPPAIRDHALSEKTPNYSTDINQAWKVVEELNSRGWPFVVMLDQGGQAIAWTGPQAEVYAGGEAVDAQFTVPEAICKAALLAMEDQGKM